MARRRIASHVRGHHISGLPKLKVRKLGKGGRKGRKAAGF